MPGFTKWEALTLNVARRDAEGARHSDMVGQDYGRDFPEKAAAGGMRAWRGGQWVGGGAFL